MRRLLILACFSIAGLSASWAQDPGDPSNIDRTLVRKTVNVCWGEDAGTCATDRDGWPGTSYHHACNSSNPGGFDARVICPEVCGSKMGPKCLAYSKSQWGWSGGNCGYRLSVVACYK